MRRKYDLSQEIVRAPKQYKGEQTVVLRLKGATQFFSTGATSSATAIYAIGNVTSQIIDWSDQLAYWDEYVILSSITEVICITPSTTGSSRFWVQKTDSAPGDLPGNAETRNNVRMMVHSNNFNNRAKFTYKNEDYINLIYRPTSDDYIMGYFNGVTNNANFGTTAINSALFQYRTYYTVKFRGKKD